MSFAGNRITVVCGAPGSGKTTYVNERRKPGDVVFDFDLVMHAITGAEVHHTPALAVRYAKAMRKAFYAEAKMPNGHRIWIVESCPTVGERAQFAREFNAGVVLMETPEDVCIERVRERGPEWPAIVSRWFRSNEDHFGTAKVPTDAR